MIGAPQVGTLTERTAETSSPVPYPSVISAGDLLVLMGSTRATGVNITTPGGWTQAAQLSPNAGAANGDTGAWYKYATGSETGTLAVAHTSQASIWQMLAVSGVDGTTPLDVAVSTVDQTAALTTTIPGVTIVTTGAMLIAIGSINSTTGNATASPTGFTETGQRSTGTATSEFSYLLGQASGATGNVVITWSQAVRSVGILLALRPSATPVTGTFSTTLAGATFVASGTETVSGTLAAALAAATLAGTGTETIAGTVSAALAGALLAGTGTETLSGALTTTLTGATFTASGTSLTNVTGTLSVSLAGATLTCAGSVTGGPTLDVVVLTVVAVERTVTVTDQPRPVTLTDVVRDVRVGEVQRTVALSEHPRAVIIQEVPA